MGTVTCKVYTLDDTMAHDPIAGVLIRIFNSAGNTFITSGTTNGSGMFQVDLPGTASPTPTRYQLRCSKLGVTFLNPEYADVYDPLPPLTVNEFNVYGDTHPISEALNPLMCRAEGFFLDPGGRPLPDLLIRFMNLQEPMILDGIGILHKLEVRTDSRGWVAVELPRNGHYIATVSGLHDERLEVQVPDRSSVNLIDLLWPQVALVTFSPAPPWNIPVGTSLDVVPTVTASSYYELTGAAVDDLTYSVEDTTVAAVSTGADKITLHGGATGSTSLTVTRKDTSISRLPEVPLVGTGGVIMVA